MELIEVKVGEEIWKVKKLNSYQVSKLIGPGDRDLADIHMGMILASVVEPKINREKILEFAEDEERYFALVQDLERINEKGIRALGNYVRSSVTSLEKSKTSSNST